jgi:hypothetical protein
MSYAMVAEIAREFFTQPGIYIALGFFKVHEN